MVREKGELYSRKIRGLLGEEEMGGAQGEGGERRGAPGRAQSGPPVVSRPSPGYCCREAKLQERAAQLFREFLQWRVKQGGVANTKSVLWRHLEVVLAWWAVLLGSQALRLQVKYHLLSLLVAMARLAEDREDRLKSALLSLALSRNICIVLLTRFTFHELKWTTAFFWALPWDS